MRHLVFAALLPLAACHAAPQAGDSATVANGSGATTLSPVPQPVRIGEGGANFPACDTRGVITSGDPTLLPVRAAPFDEAQQTGTLGPGEHVSICTRSLDQRWLGVVADGQGPTPADCGVSEPVESPRDYGGRCMSGWVQSARVQLTAN